MTPSEYLAAVTPSAKRSKLTPHVEAIATLRAAGCSLRQICEYLEKNDVSMNPSGLAKFIKKIANVPAAVVPQSAVVRATVEPPPIARKQSAPSPQPTPKPHTDDQPDAFKTMDQLRTEHPRMPAVQLSRLYSAQFDQPVKNRYL